MWQHRYDNYMKFLQAVFWEFIQNLPLVTGFVLAIWFWEQRAGVGVGVSIGAGSLGGALLIGWSEPKVVKGHQESFRQVIANTIIFSTAMFALSAYFAAPWANWTTDVLIGLIGGGIVGMAQSWAVGKKADMRHSAAFAASFALSLILIKMLVLMNLPAWATIFAITTAITIIISLVDYGPMFLHHAD